MSLPEPGPTAAPRWRAWLALAALAAGLVYLFAPLTYTYFDRQKPYFHPYPRPVGLKYARLLPVIAYKQAWLVEADTAFVDHDVSCQLEPLPTAGGSCERLLPSDAMIYGPYERLPKGHYEARFHIVAPAGCATTVMVDVLSLNVSDQPFEVARFTPGRDTLASLKFRVGDDAALNGAFEFRARHEGGPPCAVLKSVGIHRVGS